MKSPAQYKITGTFDLTDRGVILVGFIINGEINIGDYIWIEYDNKRFISRIKGIEMLNVKKSNKSNLGLLIDFENDKEISEIIKHRPLPITAIVNVESDSLIK